ncbi:MAG: NAD(P)H-quinone oxidoreductase subunit F [Gomphosphaeria aponina SAG 52.96 = DSM 107014]|uniref:NAD(P)H-quinone oxidoreductase subunit F n=1 Tax=Gomphosphaeria aponina SAG 52.96 = DSM 107014 TaxID=1521640 RepID=A0A941JMD9_9CHRO|nr:NAD(P)H-quinone oxidoreductase subunit F [Gomphosphaeria aponina SAG 52.96 = DSM 107014]
MLDSFSQTIWLVPLYALIGALLALIWSPGVIRRTGPRPAGYINLLTTFLAFLHSILALREVWQQPAQDLRFPWLSAAGLEISFDLRISAISVGALALITGLNFLAGLFAVGYMEMDWGWARFYALMGVFEAGLCGLALCNSLFFSYVYLEILTLGTYLIVGFWFPQPLVVTGARDAFWTKRVGDLLLLMGVIALWPITGTWNYSDLAIWTNTWAKTVALDPFVINFVCLALVFGPLAKCAQFPFQLWLDEAMEGPIPASILRNSVVVATGSYVLIQLEPVLSLSPVSTFTMIVIGSITAMGASLIAIAQVDIKRALSYSVNAYMAFVFIAVGVGQNHAALLLILVHALAMSLLYMSAGCIISNNITQDITQLGGLWSRRPFPAIAFLVGAAALIALPPFGGFWGLLELTNQLWTTKPILVGVVLLVDCLTAFNLIRVFSLVFGGLPKQMTERSPEVLWAMVLPMMILTGFSFHLPLVLKQFNIIPSWANLNHSLALLLIVSSTLGSSLAAFLYLRKEQPKPIQLVPTPLRELLANDLYIQKIYRITIVALVGITSKITAWVDRYIVDGAVNLVGVGTLFGGQALKYSTTGQSQVYILSIVLGLVLIGVVFWLYFEPVLGF